MEKGILSANYRKELKKNMVKKLRVQGEVPCVIYGNKKDPETVTVNRIEFEKALRTEFRRNTILKLSVNKDGKAVDEYVVTYDIERNVLTQEITHIDFLRVEKGVKVKLTVPLSFEGVAPGTKRGGVLVKKMDSVVISTLPKNIPSSINVDLSSLNIGEFVNVSNLVIGDFEILSPSSNAVVRIAAPRKAQEQQTEDDSVAATDAST